MLRHIFSCS